MLKSLVVADSEGGLPDSHGLNLISFDRYLADYPQKHEPRIRVINLCDTAHYLSRGYSR